ncbi:249_t:CDS:2 [Ambispora gerdemannii]|uniref:249_t:CDS:1 n=1 Tax=Ambispora gerdemannii TaxID=144530 RepID=A0A9N9AYX6_9GLOM|nr:249_t:CDS:2 [Ambispora gerdemannii]
MSWYHGGAVNLIRDVNVTMRVLCFVGKQLSNFCDEKVNCPNTIRKNSYPKAILSQPSQHV